MYNAQKQSEKTAKFLLNKLEILCEVSGFNIGHDSVVKHNWYTAPNNNAGLEIWIRFTEKVTKKKFFGLYKTHKYYQRFEQIAFVSFDYNTINRKITSIIINDCPFTIAQLPEFELKQYELLKHAIYRYLN